MIGGMDDILRISPEVAEAQAAGRAVVALESTLITRGLPRPINARVAARAEAAVRDAGAVPASIAVLDGRVRIGLSQSQLDRVAGEEGFAKASLRDLGSVISDGGNAGTTVAASMHLARLGGISVFATGGIGGVHRGAEDTFDISTDIEALARIPMIVVCSGAKAILDLPKTVEALETRGVPVLGYGTNRLPAFYGRDCGIGLARRIDDPDQAARAFAAHRALALNSAVVIANPIAADYALDDAVLEVAITRALAAAAKSGVGGKALTPFLLDRVAELTDGQSVAANARLIEDNAALGGQIAVALSLVGDN